MRTALTPFLDLFPGLIDRHALLGKVLMRPGVAADGVTGGGNLSQDFRIIGGVFSDREEGCLGALVRQRLEHRGGVVRPRAVVEGQNDFALFQEIVLLEMLEAEARAAGGIDFDRAREPEGIRIAACRGRRAGGGPRRLRLCRLSLGGSQSGDGRRKNERIRD
jgi:hypothetical protein